MIIRLKDFHDSLNIVVILALDHEFFLLNVPNFQCFQYYGMKLSKGYLSFETVIIHFWDKTDQEINIISHLNEELLCK